MVHNQIQQVQQRISNVNQMVSQLRQSEESTRQKLMQLAQDESYVAQQLQRVHQMCQESISGLQNISSSLRQQTYTPGYAQTPMYGQGISAGSAMQGTQQSQQGSGTLFNLATMSPDTYQNSTQFMSGQGYSGSSMIGQTGMQGSPRGMSGQTSGVGQTTGTQSSLSSISTMGPDTYQASREQLGKGSSSLSEIGQQAGISSKQ
ncbi:MAG: hypothetical protein ACOX2N_02845 [Peptococcia bacterium]|jgi:hypothetical protein